MRPQSQRLKIKCAQNLIVINGSLNCDLICIFYFFSVILHWSWFIYPNHAPRIIKTSLICNILVLSPTQSTGSCLLWLDTAAKFRHMLLVRTWSCVVLELWKTYKTTSDVILWYRFCIFSTRSVMFLQFPITCFTSNSICNGGVFCHNDNQ